MKHCYGRCTSDVHDNCPIFKILPRCPTTSKILQPIDLGRPISNEQNERNQTKTKK